MNIKGQKLTAVFGVDGTVVGYIDKRTRSGSVLAYDEDFNSVGVTKTTGGARKLINHARLERSLARSQWFRRR